MPLLLSFCFFISCEKGETGHQDQTRIEIDFSVSDFRLDRKGSTRATVAALPAEKQVDNLYVFLFPTDETQTLLAYYTDAATFTGGSWDNTEGKVIINQKQSDIGNRDVYVVANCDTDMKAALDGVDTVEGLQEIFREIAQPWQSGFSTPLLLAGSSPHDFTANFQLDNIPLERAVAKLELNITLTQEAHQSEPVSEGVAQYQYKYVDFDTRTHPVKPGTKPDHPAGSDWIAWASDTGDIRYLLDSGGTVAGLTLITYLNERDAAGAAIEIRLPYSSGMLPSPEFGDDIYVLKLPEGIERNTYYEYGIEI